MNGSPPRSVVVTGHRPQHLPRECIPWIRTTLTECLASIEQNGIEAVSGMALGVDQWFAEAAFTAGLPVHAAVPFVGQELVWKKDDQERYWGIIAKCRTVTVLHNTRPIDRGHAARLLHARNTWMAKRASLAIAVWSGKDGGTAHCVSELVSRNVPLLVLDPLTKNYRTIPAR